MQWKIKTINLRAENNHVLYLSCYIFVYYCAKVKEKNKKKSSVVGLKPGRSVGSPVRNRIAKSIHKVYSFRLRFVFGSAENMQTVLSKANGRASERLSVCDMPNELSHNACMFHSIRFDITMRFKFEIKTIN